MTTQTFAVAIPGEIDTGWLVEANTAEEAIDLVFGTVPRGARGVARRTPRVDRALLPRPLSARRTDAGELVAALSASDHLAAAPERVLLSILLLDNRYRGRSRGPPRVRVIGEVRRVAHGLRLAGSEVRARQSLREASCGPRSEYPPTFAHGRPSSPGASSERGVRHRTPGGNAIA